MTTRGALALLLTAILFPACLPHQDDVGPEHSSQKTKQAAPPPKTAASPRPATPHTKLEPRPAQKQGAPLQGPQLKDVFKDDFDRGELGPNWVATSKVWQLVDGQLCAKGARNHPVWLDRKLPLNATIEFDATSYSSDGDIKVELWGDGRSHATGASYTNATSYIAIFGGWKNTFHVLARLDEHARGRKEVRVSADPADLRAQPVEAERSYHFKLTRNDGKTLQWLVDDIEILSYNDEAPLHGAGHEHLAFNDWDVRVCFDNLVIVPL